MAILTSFLGFTREREDLAGNANAHQDEPKLPGKYK